MRNRISELRKARGWSQEQLAERIGGTVTGSTVHKLETGIMRLTLDRVERLGSAFGIDPIGVIDDRQPALSPDVAIDDTAAAVRGRAFYKVLSGALDELGYLPGDLVEVDTTEETRRHLQFGDTVVVDMQLAPDGPPVPLLRQFIEPAMLIVNSRHHNAPPLNCRSTPVHIVGVIVALHRQRNR